VTDCTCAECAWLAADQVCRAALDRMWPPEQWLGRVGTLEERNDWRPRTPEDGPRGELLSGDERIPTNEVNGELT
jgi:hypothetical protein